MASAIDCAPSKPPTRPAVRPRRGPSIRRLLLAVNAFVLLVPVLAIVLLRIYDNHLVRTTERRLIAESVLIGEAWRDHFLAAKGIHPRDAPSIQPPGAGGERFFPIDPVVDLTQGVHPPEPPPTRFASNPRGPAWRAGQAIKPLLDRAKLVNLSAARVLNAEGCVVATTGAQLGACLGALPDVRSALAGQYAAIARQRISDEPRPPLSSIRRRGTVRVFTATPLFADGRVIGIVRMSRTSLDPLEVLWENRSTLLWALLFCVGLTAAVSLFFARTIIRPVQEITAAAQTIARGQPRKPLAPGGTVPAEVHVLSAALDTMTAQLSDRAEYISEFAANVSHELKTPITAVRGAAELLRDDWAQMNDAQRQRFLDNVDADAARMERLVTRLLKLARIQSAPAAAEPIAVVPFFERIAQRHPSRVRLHTNDAPPTIVIHPDHFESAVGNLLDNALRHGGDAPVEVTVRRHADRLAIDIRDRGPGISERNQARIFDRFFTTERDRGGTGLGLAIVEAVAQTRGGSLSFDTGPDGTLFHLIV